MLGWLAFLVIFVAPFFVLRLPGVPQVPGRLISISILLFGAPPAIIWFGLKSQMIRPGGKLAQPQFHDVRPRIERNIRVLVIAFGVFFSLILTLPFAEDLFQLAANQKSLRITEVVKYVRFGSYRSGPTEQIGLSNTEKYYEIWYPTKPVKVGNAYEFVVLPRSRLILDYAESARQ